MIKNLRYAIRQLQQHPTFTLVAVLSLALGIGATSGMFSVADALLLRPLPVPQPDNVVHIENFSKSEGHQLMSWSDFQVFNKQNTSFSSLIAYTDSSIGYKREANSLAHLASALLVSGTFFQDLRVQPILGRPFRPEENYAPGRDAVAVLSYDFWRTEFDGKATAIGQHIRLNGTEFTVIGVAPPTFTGMDQFLRPHLFAPLAMAGKLGDADLWTDRGARRLKVNGRLKPGVTIARAQAQLASIASFLSDKYPKTNRSEYIRVNTELQARLANAPEDSMLVSMLLLLSLCVLVVACANVAGLLMSRARARSKEIAVRLAIGASRTKLISQLLLESLLLALAGGAGGAAIGYGTVQYFAQAIIPDDLPMSPVFVFNLRMLGFTLFVSIVSTVLFGLIPAVVSTRIDLVSSLKAMDADSKRKRRLWGRNGLVVSQVAVSVVLMVVSALLFQNFTRILGSGPGFRTDHLLMMSFNPSLVQYTPDQTRAFYRRLVDEAEAVPGVESASLSYVVPMSQVQDSERFVPEGYHLEPGEESILVAGNIVGPRYFESFGIPLVSGRSFDAHDKEDSAKVVVINEALALKFFKGRNALDQRIRLGDKSGPLAQIVGIVKTSKVFWVGEAPQPVLYLPFSQDFKNDMTLMLHSRTDAAGLVTPLREIVARIDSGQPVFDVRTMADYYLKRAVLNIQLVLASVAVLACMGLFLSMVGLYGVVSFSVGRRTREIGLRMALGAAKPQVLRMVLSQGLALAGSGAVLGVVLSFGARSIVGSLIYNGSRLTDFMFAGLAGVFIIFITLLATFAPARRASMIDPMRALRDE